MPNRRHLTILLPTRTKMIYSVQKTKVRIIRKNQVRPCTTSIPIIKISFSSLTRLQIQLNRNQAPTFSKAVAKLNHNLKARSGKKPISTSLKCRKLSPRSRSTGLASKHSGMVSDSLQETSLFSLIQFGSCSDASFTRSYSSTDPNFQHGKSN